MPKQSIIVYLSVAVLVVASAIGGIAFRPQPIGESVTSRTAIGAGASIDLQTDRLHVAYHRDGILYAIEDHFLYISTDTGRNYRQMGGLPKPAGASVAIRLQDRLSRSEIVRGIRRNRGPSSVVVLQSGTILVFFDQIYRSEDGGRTFTIVEGTSAADLPKPFPSSLGIAVGPDDVVYYGEYETSRRPREVRVVRGIDDGRRWEIAHTFPAGEIFHVHSIKYDPFRRRFWIATGDRDDEARLMYTEDQFETLQTLSCCSQNWRIVDLIVTDSALVWGSDDNRDPGIYRYDLIADSLHFLGELDNPSYHAALMADGTMAITTTYEADLRQTREAVTSLWLSRDGWEWTRALTLTGDSAAWRGNSAARPQMQLPSGDPLPALFVTPWHTTEHDFVTFRIRTK